jgi:hypothetical protein
MHLERLDVATAEIIRNVLASATSEIVSLVRSPHDCVISESQGRSVSPLNDQGQLLGQAPRLPLYPRNAEEVTRIATRLGVSSDPIHQFTAR